MPPYNIHTEIFSPQPSSGMNYHSDLSYLFQVHSLMLPDLLFWHHIYFCIRSPDPVFPIHMNLLKYYFLYNLKAFLLFLLNICFVLIHRTNSSAKLQLSDTPYISLHFLLQYHNDQLYMSAFRERFSENHAIFLQSDS